MSAFDDVFIVELFTMKALILGAVLALAAVPAAAVTVVLDQNINNPDVQYYTTTQDFTLPSGFTNASLNIASFTADDAAVITVNGTPIVGTGIFGPGNGNFFFTAVGPSVPYAFAYGNGAVNASFSGPFVVGLNTISIIVNNNNAGININNGPLTGGPSSLEFTGTVTYDTSVVPEPAVWALAIVGFTMVGASMRRRRPARVLA